MKQIDFVLRFSWDFRAVYEEIRSESVGDYLPSATRLITFTGTGRLAERRAQKCVIVTGFFRSHMPRDYCECFLAPRPEQTTAGHAFCRSGCPTVVNGREYVNCSEREIYECMINTTEFGLKVGELSEEVIEVEMGP